MQKSIYSAANLRLLAWLRKSRQDKGLTMRDLASRLEVPHSFVGKVETGERRLDVTEYLIYCRTLGIDPHEGMKLALHQLPTAERQSGRLLAAESREPYGAKSRRKASAG